MNYIDKLLELLSKEQIKPGTICHVQIRHDDDCPILRGTGPCECEPDIKVHSEH